MKKTYIAPTIEVVPVKMAKILSGSNRRIISNVDFEDYIEETPSSFSSGDIR